MEYVSVKASRPVLKSTKVKRHKNSVVLSREGSKVVDVMMLKIKMSAEEGRRCHDAKNKNVRRGRPYLIS